MFSLMLALMIGVASPSDEGATSERESTILTSELDVIAERLRDAAVKVNTMGGHGSGTYYTWKGKTFVITAAHVVDSEKIVFVGKPGAEQAGQVIYVDSKNDVAVIDVTLDVKPMFYRPTKDIASIGDQVTVVGYPAAYDALTIRGEIAGYEPSESGVYIICHGWAWPGMSGAAVVDTYGRTVGVISAVGVGMSMLGGQLLDDVVWIKPITIDDDLLREILTDRW
jgi:S1-C subfamily serine protease